MSAAKKTDRPCPACGQPTVWKDNLNRPFCSKRCKMNDLEGWMSARYRIPGRPMDPQTLNEEAGTEEDDGEK